MTERVRTTIKQHQMFTAGDNVIVGLSGGADSVALLHVLLVLREALDLGHIIPIHINHNLRGNDSDHDEKFAKTLCDQFNLKLVVYPAHVKAFATEKGIGTEEAGRILRYTFMQEAKNTWNAQKIATGHHQDDNAETILMNLCRGAGLRGLCGIPPVNGAIVRPLIDIPRVDIEKYLMDTNINFVTDATNHSDDYTRNRVRNKLIPLLETYVNPKVSETITRNAEWLRADERFLEGIAWNAYASCALTPLTLDIPRLSELPPAISRRVVRIAIAEAREGSADISSAHVLSVLALAQGHSGRVVHLSGLVVKKEYSTLIFSRQPETPSTFSYPLALESTIYIPEIGKTVTVSRDMPDKQQKNLRLYCTKAFDYGIVDMTTSNIRTRQAGDKITLADGSGRQFTKKLQDYFTDTKIPATERDSIPLIAMGSDILWIMDTHNRTNAKYTSSTGEKIWITLWEG
ncbi:MAG: tRNA lysidine(34) synthetase TilS [Defluviitaleaceae bacterium]|nr:tRNA lysidine(34) synthetase TilS [Defluviitaleaceae bacterium]